MIIDASIILKWLWKEDEKNVDAAETILDNHTSGKEICTVPSFAFLEIANVLATKTNIPPNKIEPFLDSLFAINLENYQLNESDIKEASILAKRYKTTVYDMQYVVVAKKFKTFLLTTDAKFVKATKFPHVKLLSGWKK